jgi:hypothetical protein
MSGGGRETREAAAAAAAAPEEGEQASRVGAFELLRGVTKAARPQQSKKERRKGNSINLAGLR